MLPLELVLLYKGIRHPIGLINPDQYKIENLRVDAVRITSIDGLANHEMFKMMCKEPRTDKKKLIMSSLDMWIQCFSHDNQGVKTIEIELIPYPRTGMPFMIQPFLTNLQDAFPEPNLPNSIFETLQNASLTHQNPNNAPLEVVTNLCQTRTKSAPIQIAPTKPTPNEDLPNLDDNDTSNDDWSGCSDGGYSNDNEVDASGDVSDDDVNGDDGLNNDDGRDDHVSSVGVVGDGEVNCGELVTTDDNEGNDILSGPEEEEENMPFSSDEEDHTATAKMMKYIKVNEYKTPENGIDKLFLGAVFDNAEEFKGKLHNIMIKEGFDVEKIYNDKNRYHARCKVKDCPWSVTCGLLGNNGGFVIRKLNEVHTCFRAQKNAPTPSHWIVEKIKDLVKETPKIKISQIRSHLKAIYGVTPNNLKLYRAKKKVEALLGGDHSKGYEKLFQYQAMVEKHNVGSKCKVLCDTESIPGKIIFKRFFVSLPAQKNAFLNGCRPYIGIDGCHLRGEFGGILMAAVGVDANNGIVPLAYAVCEIEDQWSWGWFLSLLHEYFDDGRKVTFMSDRQKGLISALQHTWPTAHSRHCGRHIYANFRGQFSGLALKKLFWRACKASNRTDFFAALDRMRSVKDGAREWFDNLEDYQWSRWAFDKNAKVDHTTNNTTECFNSWIGKYREKPCLTMLEEIRCKLMKRFTKRKKEAQMWPSILTPRIKKQIDETSEVSSKLSVKPSGDTVFQVKDINYTPLRWFIVDVENKTCDCGYWEISGLPCRHAMASIMYCRHNIHHYIPYYFTKQAYLDTYSVMVHPIPDQVTWEAGDKGLINPPVKRRQAGRPKKLRRREPNEPVKSNRSFVIRCCFCHSTTHNVRTCQLAPSNAKKSSTRQNQRLGMKAKKQLGESSQPAAKKTRKNKNTNLKSGQKCESSQRIPICQRGKSSQLRQGAQSSTQQALTQSSQTSANVRNPRQRDKKTNARGITQSQP